MNYISIKNNQTIPICLYSGVGIFLIFRAKRFLFNEKCGVSLCKLFWISSCR